MTGTTKAPRSRRIAAALVIVLASVAAALAFAAVSATTTSQPGLEPFDGWVAVLTISTDPTAHQVLLRASAVTPGAAGDRPAVTYSVSVCGDRPFHGALFIGGDARLSDPVLFPPLGANPPNSVSLQTTRGLRLNRASTGSSLRLGTVQVLRLDMTSVSRCLSPFSSSVRDAGFASTAAQTISGRVQAPIRRTGRAWWRPWAGPRESQSWPLIGTLPRTPAAELGAFNALGRDWLRPRTYFAVEAGALKDKVVAEFARPAPSEVSELTWDQTMPMRPVARALDTDALSRWQQYLVAATIALSIGASLLAAALYDWLRRPPAPAPATPASREPAAATGRRAEPASRLSEAVGLAVLGTLAWLLSRQPRRRDQ